MEWTTRAWEIFSVFAPLCLGIAVVVNLITLADTYLCKKKKP